MGLLTETERLRGFPDSQLRKLTDVQVIMLSIAIIFEVHGIDDRPLIEELFKRGREVPK